MEQIPGKTPGRISRAVILLALDILYLSLVAVTFIFNIDLAADNTMQYILNITVILSAFAVLFFAEMVYRTEEDKADGRLCLIFAAMFAALVLIGRSLGIAAISTDGFGPGGGAFNFYAGTSVSRIIEVTSWTTLFPLFMLFLSKTFFRGRRGKLLGILCLLSAICCFIGFISIVSQEAVFLWIGITGWGGLFLLIVIVYICREVRSRRAV